MFNIDFDPVLLVFYGMIGIFVLGLLLMVMEKIGILAFILPAISAVLYALAWVADYFQWSSIYSSINEFSNWYNWGVGILFVFCLVDKPYDKDKLNKTIDDLARAERRNYNQYVAHQHAQRTSAGMCGKK